MENTELNELKNLVAELRADHAAQKAKEKRDAWTKYVSLSMVCIAVLAALATLKGGGFSSRTLQELNEANFNQAQASDQWAFFEARSIKENQCEIEMDRLNAAPTPDTAAVARMKAKIAKYESERTDITGKAKQFENLRDEARNKAANASDHSRRMGLSVTLFQIAISLGAMCLIVKKKPLWIFSMLFGALAALQMLYVLYGLPL